MLIKGVNLKETNVPPHIKETSAKALEALKVGTAKEIEKLNQLLNKVSSVQEGLRPRYADPKPLQELNVFCEEVLRKHSERSKDKELKRKRYAKRHKQI